MTEHLAQQRQEEIGIWTSFSKIWVGETGEKSVFKLRLLFVVQEPLPGGKITPEMG